MGPWLSPEDLESVRRKVPMVYVTAVPVRLDTDGCTPEQACRLLLPRIQDAWRGVAA